MGPRDFSLMVIGNLTELSKENYSILSIEWSLVVKSKEVILNWSLSLVNLFSFFLIKSKKFALHQHIDPKWSCHPYFGILIQSDLATHELHWSTLNVVPPPRFLKWILFHHPSMWMVVIQAQSDFLNCF